MAAIKTLLQAECHQPEGDSKLNLAHSLRLKRAKSSQFLFRPPALWNHHRRHTHPYHHIMTRVTGVDERSLSQQHWRLTQCAAFLISGTWPEEKPLVRRLDKKARRRRMIPRRVGN